MNKKLDRRSEPSAFVINTFDDSALRSRGPELVWRVWESLFQPLEDRLDEPGWSGRVSWELSPGSRHRAKPLGEQHLETALDVLMTREFGGMECQVALESQAELQFWIEAPYEFAPDSGYQIWLALDDDVRAAYSEDVAVGVELVRLAKEIAVGTRAVTGGVDRDAGISFSAEENNQVGDSARVREQAEEFVRGAYWGLLLGPMQVERLGGLERVRSDAPVALVEDLSRDGHTLVWLQLTEAFEVVTDAKRAALRTFLAPVIRPAPPVVDVEALTVQVLRHLGESRLVVPARPFESASQPGGAGELAIVREAGWDDEPDIEFALRLPVPASEEQMDALRRVLSAWYLLGEKGAFQGWFHDLSKPAQDAEDVRFVIEWWADLGSADPHRAVDALAGALQGLAQDFGWDEAELVIKPSGG